MLSRGDVAEAERLLRCAIDTDPQALRPWLTLAAVLYKRGDFDSARNLLAELSPERRDLPEVQYALDLLPRTPRISAQPSSTFRACWRSGALKHARVSTGHVLVSPGRLWPGG